jgi:hypothetical protein
VPALTTWNQVAGSMPRAKTSSPCGALSAAPTRPAGIVVAVVDSERALASSSRRNENRTGLTRPTSGRALILVAVSWGMEPKDVTDEVATT